MKGLKTPLSHGLTGFVAIKQGAKEPVAARAACGLSEAALRSQSQRGQTAAPSRNS